MALYSVGIEYREIAGFPMYRVGNDGSVWSLYRGKWKKLGTETLKCGHLRVKLYPGGIKFLVHRLVLEAFVGPCPNGMEACHDPDLTPANNCVGNLRWDTRLANQADSVKHGTRVRGERTGRCRLKAPQVIEIRRLLDEGWTMQRLADAFGVYSSAINSIKHRKSWAHL